MTRRPRRRELMAEIAALRWQVRKNADLLNELRKENEVMDAALEAERQWRLKGSVPALLAAEEKAQTWRAAALEAQAERDGERAKYRAAESECAWLREKLSEATP